MSEVNVRKWHNITISSHFSSKIGHVKMKLQHLTCKSSTAHAFNET